MGAYADKVGTAQLYPGSGVVSWRNGGRYGSPEVGCAVRVRDTALWAQERNCSRPSILAWLGGHGAIVDKSSRAMRVADTSGDGKLTAVDAALVQSRCW